MRQVSNQVRQCFSPINTCVNSYRFYSVLPETALTADAFSGTRRADGRHRNFRRRHHRLARHRHLRRPGQLDLRGRQLFESLEQQRAMHTVSRTRRRCKTGGVEHQVAVVDAVELYDSRPALLVHRDAFRIPPSAGCAPVRQASSAASAA